MSQEIEFLTIDEVRDLPLRLDAIGTDAVHRVLNEALARVYHRSVEQTLVSMPHFIVPLLRAHAEKEALRAGFQKRRPDLAADWDFIKVLSATEEECPGKGYDAVLEMAVEKHAKLAQARARARELSEPEPKAPSPEEADEALNGVL